MAKLYSTILYMRIQGSIEGCLPEEQFGFRPGRGCADAIHVLRMVVESLWSGERNFVGGSGTQYDTEPWSFFDVERRLRHTNA